MSDKPLWRAIQDWNGSHIQKPNWNSYDANPVSDATIQAATELANLLEGKLVAGRKITSACPLPGGGIELSDGDESVWIEVNTL